MSERDNILFKKKLIFLSFFIFALILMILFLLRFCFFGDEDLWIKDSRGVYIKHGNPSALPEEVQKQQEAIGFALQIYNSKKIVEMNFSSQCLGIVGDYAIDIVHVPRTIEDNLLENQCEDFKLGKVKHFIELDKNGNVVKVV